MASRPSLRKLPDPILPAEGPPSPTSPLECGSVRSPRGKWRERDSGGVGLGFVAALGTAAAESPPTNKLQVSAPIAIVSPRAAACRGRIEVSELGCSGRCATSVCGGEAPASGGFLSCCFLCRKRLDGKDIYMYRGEKGFCSMECRYQQIVSDEYQAAKPAEISISPYAGGRIFFTGIITA